MLFGIRSRILVISVGLATLGWVLWPTPSYSAEIGCATVWGRSVPDVTPEKLDQIYRSRFPSGRRPILGRSCFSGFLRGTIVQGDDQKLLQFYRANHPVLSNFLLISPGGNVGAAINIGRLFRKYLIMAYAPVEVSPGVRERPWGDANGKIVDWCSGQSCVCASACALIWFGAVEREGEVGLHRPTTEDPTFRALPPAEASNIYRKILSSVTDYLDEMETPRPMIDAMVSTSSSEIRRVDADDGVRRPPSIAEWEDTSCGSFTSEERSAFYKLAVKDHRSSQEQLFLKLLNEKLQKDGSCRTSLLDAQRDRLAPP
jgi:hypothetical protein